MDNSQKRLICVNFEDETTTSSTDTNSECGAATVSGLVSTWTPSDGWRGPTSALYRSFDNSDGLVFIEGTQEMNTNPLVSGKVRF